MNGATPRSGDVFWCYFPEVGKESIPSNKAHPVLVLHAGAGMDGMWWMVVACGSGKGTPTKNPGIQLKDTDLILCPHAHPNVSGLKEETRVDLACTAYLPFTDQWFPPSPTIGRLTDSQHKSFQTVVEKVLRTLIGRQGERQSQSVLVETKKRVFPRKADLDQND